LAITPETSPETSPEKSPEKSTEDLAVRAQAGEDGCFDELVRRMRPRLRRFLAARIGSDADADDVAQETFVKALANLERYDPRYRFSTWLFTIGTNLAASHQRARRSSASLEVVEEVAAAGVDAETELIARDAGARLWERARTQLSPAHYQALWMRYAEDADIAEIARRTGRTAISVRVLLYRARRKLAKEEL
jgi:RNA polymerase sigma-70 factor (ECF subfamily)